MTDINDDEYIVIGVDPGEDTGVSVLSVLPDESDGLKLVRQIDLTTVVYAMRTHQRWKVSPVTKVSELRHRYVTSYGIAAHRVLVVCEDFHLDQGKPNVNTTALKIIGGFEHEPYPVIYQNRTEAKNLVTDDVLKRLDLMVRPKTPNRHINDATRHAVLRLVHLRHRWTMETGWPNSDSERFPSSSSES